MTTTIAFSDSADGGVYSWNANYWTARAGSGQTVTNNAEITWGQGYNTPAFPGANYVIDQAFLTFTFTPPTSAERVVSAEIWAYSTFAYNTSVNRYITWVERDWGGTLEPADYVPCDTLNAITPLLANVGPEAEEAVGQWMTAGSDALAARVAVSSPLRVVGASDRARTGAGTLMDERCNMYSSDSSGTSTDPRLVFTTVAVSTLHGVLGAQVQLTDGTHAFLESNASGTITLKHHNNTSASTIGTLSLGSSTATTQLASTWSGAQSFALVVDGSNNLYVIGRQAGTDNNVCVETWTKGSGYTWTLGTRRAAALPSYIEGSLNNFAGAWHNVGTNGTIMLVASHSAGRAPQTGSDIVYALLDCQYLLSGTGALFRNSGAAQGVVVRGPLTTPYSSIFNQTGTLLDVAAAVGSNTRGYVFTHNGYTDLGENSTFEVARYVLASDGTSVVDMDLSESQWGVKDGQAKARVLGIDSTVFVGVSTDYDPGWGLTVNVQQNFGTSPTFSQLAYLTLDGEIATLPAAATMATSQEWDAVYDPTGGRMWLYYLDRNNSQRLLRTSVDMNTYLPNGDAVEVNASLAASSTTNYAVRVHRGRTYGQRVLVAVANKTAGGTHSTIYTVDSFNAAPTSPTLTPKTNFDAGSSATLDWTFNDPNPGDTQSGYQLQINSASGVFEYDSGRISSSAASYLGVGTMAAGDNATLSPALPAGTQAGDLLLMLASIRSSGTGSPNTPSGWSSVLDMSNLKIFAKIQADTESASASINFSSGASGDTTLAQVAAFRNVPLNVVATATQLNGSAANIAYPGVTVPIDNTAIIGAAWKQDDWTSISGGPGTLISSSATSTLGNDASEAWWRTIQTAKSNISSGTITVTGGASAVSRAGLVVLGPAGHIPTVVNHSLAASALTNGGNWQWRVRTWDSVGAVGPFSDYGSFSTAAGGNVTITDPAADNPAGVVSSSYDIDWSVSGTTQAEYRVTATRNDTGASVLDTGYVSSSTTTNYVVTGLVSDVEHTIGVTVKNGSGVASGTGTRKITPSYGTPEIPQVTLTNYDDAGYILVAVNNPPSGSVSLGTVPYTFESGVTGFVVSPSASATFTQSSSAAHTGSYSGLMNVTVGGSASFGVRSPISGSPEITPGRRYTVTYWAISNTALANVGADIDWYNSASAYLSTSVGNGSLSASTWTSRAYTATAPASAAYATFGPSLSGSPSAGTKLWVDELILTDANDRPPVITNQIMRRVSGTDSDYDVIAEIGEDGTYRDYAVASGTTYEYLVRGQA